MRLSQKQSLNSGVMLKTSSPTSWQAQTLPNMFTMLPSDKVKNSLLLIEKLESDFWFCPECDDCSVMNMKLTNDLAKKDDCKHSFAAKVLERMTKAETLDLSEQDQVFVV